MNVLMALVDYIPVTAFLVAAVILQRELYHLMSKGAFALFSAGTITVFVAGFFKATWKLLFALGVCDFQALSGCFFPMQTTGFVLAALGLVAMLCHRLVDGKSYAFTPAVFFGTMFVVVLMVAGVATLDTCLIIIAVRRRKYAAVIAFAVSFVFILAMGYLSSRDFTQASMNWIAEAVNTIGQGALLTGSLLIREKKQAAA